MLDFYVTFFSGPDWVTIFSFFAVATFYFLAPCIGYRAKDSQILTIPMYLLAMIVALNFIASRLMPERDLFSDSRRDVGTLLPMLAWVKAALQFGVMVVIVWDLQRLRMENTTGDNDESAEESDDTAAGLEENGDAGGGQLQEDRPSDQEA